MSSWERDPLLAKAKLFFQYALEHERDSPRFGLWCALGLELLARAAVASVSPTLLAEPDREHRFLLHALGRGDPRVGERSLSAVQVINLCEKLFDDFKSDQRTVAVALMNRRNAELHSGQAAFSDYTTQHWISGFYSCCRVLAGQLGESVSTVLGESEAEEANRVLASEKKIVLSRVQNRIAQYRAVFEDKPEIERNAAKAQAEALGETLAYRRHHRVTCPACGSVATVQGEPLGDAKVVHGETDREIAVRQPMAPRKFACPACGLKFETYAELLAAGLGDQYTRSIWYSPEEYYELISPDDDSEIERIAREHLGMYSDSDYHEEYDNE